MAVSGRAARLMAGGILPVLAVLAPVSPFGGPAGAAAGQPAVAATIQVGPGRDQVIAGFGFSEAFAEYDIGTVPAATRARAFSLLFDRRTGAGLDIVRFGLPAPAGTVADQLPLARTAEHYGVRTFYADAITAPAAFKTNHKLIGGTLCGAPGTPCKYHDARAAYAAYLAAQVKAFAAHGVHLRAIGFTNEPEIAPPYPGMLMSPAQVANFIPYLGRALRADHLSTVVSCCDDIGWTSAQTFARAALASPAAARYVGLITAHCYGNPPVFPITTGRPLWETEWSNFQPWDPRWDDGTAASGLAWANNIYTGLTAADVNAFFYWWGAFTAGQYGVDNEGLIKFRLHRRGYQVAARLWAFAGFSRYVRPGAVRLTTTSSDPDLAAVAFRQGRGTVLVVINNHHQPVSIASDTAVGTPGARVQPYVTNGSSHTLAVAALSATAGHFTSVVPPRTLETYVITPATRPRK